MRNFKTYGSPERDAFMLALLSHGGGVSETMATIAAAILERYQGEPVPFSFSELSELTGKTYPAVNSAIKNLVAAGFIRKSILPARRMAERKNQFEPLLPDLKAVAKAGRAARLERECAEAAARWRAKAAAKPLAVVAES